MRKNKIGKQIQDANQNATACHRLDKFLTGFPNYKPCNLKIFVIYIKNLDYFSPIHFSMPLAKYLQMC
jgi:hypothetical protein